ncbi:monooxygenase, ferredoxin reductase component [Seminavis robusta]|uniref:Monooxygenase, ferredoxin reductase component n=1 Tax=Seminavis robusta TaxID=568900 RepID=A0A9N8HST2_9STRA|nr:monooxygenase, ferredoxin reductase component [Seminavis robusta]|eukprot:Sro1198_g251640.1 monooxygenase, ferredoxin reductase component (570) ;mRNA; r:28413-30122
MAPFTASFHAGELSAQEKAGTRGVAAELLPGKTGALNFSKNHDAFLAAQSFAVVSIVQNGGHVWVTPLFGKAGDITAVSESEIVISPNSIPKNDILHSVLASPDNNNTPLSMLGIDLVKRIRHRINGASVSSTDNVDLHFQVKEYSPNCPKYINRRQIIPSDTPINDAAVRQERVELTPSDREFVQSMDTLWIGSYAPNVGADANHRGGRPGFIRVASNNTIEWPEYRGNGMFYTSGNLEVNDRAGVTLVDFETGSMIQMTGRATVGWHHNNAANNYEGATRLMKFQIERLVRTDYATNHRWKLLDYSPYNPAISGSDNNAGDDNTNSSIVTLAKIVSESRNVKTFRWVAQRNIVFLPGQYATFEFDKVPGGSASEVRTWTLSETPNSIKGDNTLDITVKRNGLVTNWLHDHAEVGLQVKLNGMQGDMTAVTFDSQTQKPVIPKHLLLMSAGIGITPNLAMVRGVGAFELQDDTSITMIHVERNEADLVSQGELNRRARNYPSFSYTNVISSKEGRLTRERLGKLLPEATMGFQEAYICGPESFMSDMTEHLVAMGVPAGNIHTESFDF